MVWIARGQVHNGGIVFVEPLVLPEGAEVIVQIEPLVSAPQAVKDIAGEDFTDQPFFGMWANRKDMEDSAAWVRRQRARWQRRANRLD
jgi:hypothetical protein